MLVLVAPLTLLALSSGSMSSTKPVDGTEAAAAMIIQDSPDNDPYCELLALCIFLSLFPKYVRSSDSLEEEEVHEKTFKKLNLEAHTNSLDGTKITQRKSALRQEKYSFKYDVKVAITKLNSLVDVTIKKRTIQGRIQP